MKGASPEPFVLLIAVWHAGRRATRERRHERQVLNARVCSKIQSVPLFIPFQPLQSDTIPYSSSIHVTTLRHEAATATSLRHTPRPAQFRLLHLQAFRCTTARAEVRQVRADARTAAGTTDCGSAWGEVVLRGGRVAGDRDVGQRAPLRPHLDQQLATREKIH